MIYDTVDLMRSSAIRARPPVGDDGGLALEARPDASGGAVGTPS